MFTYIITTYDVCEHLHLITTKTYLMKVKVHLGRLPVKFYQSTFEGSEILKIILIKLVISKYDNLLKYLEKTSMII